MRAYTIVTLLSSVAAGLATPMGDGSASGLVSLPYGGDGAITLCCSGDFDGTNGAGKGGTPTCVAYNSAIQNCAAGQLKFTCPVTRGVLQGCSDPAGTAAATSLISEVVNLVPSLLNLNI